MSIKLHRLHDAANADIKQMTVVFCVVEVWFESVASLCHTYQDLIWNPQEHCPDLVDWLYIQPGIPWTNNAMGNGYGKREHDDTLYSAVVVVDTTCTSTLTVTKLVLHTCTLEGLSCQGQCKAQYWSIDNRKIVLIECLSLQAVPKNISYFRKIVNITYRNWPFCTPTHFQVYHLYPQKYSVHVHVDTCIAIDKWT